MRILGHGRKINLEIAELIFLACGFVTNAVGCLEYGIKCWWNIMRGNSYN
jgi:hypothetical protein